jgi:hypothetical protein
VEPRWSNDGRSVAFDYRPDQHSEIYRVDVSGGPPRFIPTIPGADNVVPSWSRDGKWIYFSSNRGNEPNQIWKVPDAGGTPIQLTRAGGTSPNESADGFVYYSKTFRSDEIWKIPAGGGETLVIKSQVWIPLAGLGLRNLLHYRLTEARGAFMSSTPGKYFPSCPRKACRPARRLTRREVRHLLQIDQWNKPSCWSTTSTDPISQLFVEARLNCRHGLLRFVGETVEVFASS